MHRISKGTANLKPFHSLGVRCVLCFGLKRDRLAVMCSRAWCKAVDGADAQGGPAQWR